MSLGEPTLETVKTKLLMTRYAVIDLMPGDLQRLLQSYHGCASRQETYQWRRDVIDQLIEVAASSPLPTPPILNQFRALCPLCKGGTTAPYEQGFSLPEGMNRHLGGHGRSNQCSVMTVALDLASEHWDSKFAEKERQEAESARDRMRERRGTETLYVTEKGARPVLVDEGVFGRARDAASLDWAVSRLATLGLEEVRSGQVVSYVLKDGGLEVHADPRREGEITFQTMPAAAKRRPRRRGLDAAFALRDVWKHDLREKFRERMQQAEGAWKVAEA